MDKNTYKVLKYIDSDNKPKSFADVVNQFGKQCCTTTENSIFSLDTDKMVSISYTYDGDGNALKPLSVAITCKGKEYIEKQSSQLLNNMFTRVLSISALIVSVGSLIVSILALMKK